MFNFPFEIVHKYTYEYKINQMISLTFPAIHKAMKGKVSILLTIGKSTVIFSLILIFHLITHIKY